MDNQNGDDDSPKYYCPKCAEQKKLKVKLFRKKMNLKSVVYKCHDPCCGFIYKPTQELRKEHDDECQAQMSKKRDVAGNLKLTPLPLTLGYSELLRLNKTDPEVQYLMQEHKFPVDPVGYNEKGRICQECYRITGRLVNCDLMKVTPHRSVYKCPNCQKNFQVKSKRNRIRLLKNKGVTGWYNVHENVKSLSGVPRREIVSTVINEHNAVTVNKRPTLTANTLISSHGDTPYQMAAGVRRDCMIFHSLTKDKRLNEMLKNTQTETQKYMKHLIKTDALDMPFLPLKSESQMCDSEVKIEGVKRQPRAYMNKKNPLLPIKKETSLPSSEFICSDKCPESDHSLCMFKLFYEYNPTTVGNIKLEDKPKYSNFSDCAVGVQTIPHDIAKRELYHEVRNERARAVRRKLYEDTKESRMCGTYEDAYEKGPLAMRGECYDYVNEKESEIVTSELFNSTKVVSRELYEFVSEKEPQTVTCRIYEGAYEEVPLAMRSELYNSTNTERVKAVRRKPYDDVIAEESRTVMCKMYEDIDTEGPQVIYSEIIKREIEYLRTNCPQDLIKYYQSKQSACTQDFTDKSPLQMAYDLKEKYWEDLPDTSNSSPPTVKNLVESEKPLLTLFSKESEYLQYSLFMEKLGKIKKQEVEELMKLKDKKLFKKERKE